jgi:hypothetical protein
LRDFGNLELRLECRWLTSEFLDPEYPAIALVLLSFLLLISGPLDPVQSTNIFAISLGFVFWVWNAISGVG